MTVRCSAESVDLGDPEVRHLHVVARLDHDVGGLDVAVHDAALVGGVERVGHLRADRGGALDRHLPGALDHPVEAHAVDELHRDVAQALPAADVVERDDVRVLELRRDLGLLLEALQQVLERRRRGGEALQADGLDGDHAPELLVLGLEDGAEGTGPELLLDDVAPRDLARVGGGGGLDALTSLLFLAGRPAQRAPAQQVQVDVVDAVAGVVAAVERRVGSPARRAPAPCAMSRAFRTMAPISSSSPGARSVRLVM